MVDLILSIIPGGALTAIFAIVMAALGAVWGLIRTGKNIQRNKDQAKDLKQKLRAKNERLEMHREADEAEREAARLSDEEARRRAREWAKRQ